MIPEGVCASYVADSLDDGVCTAVDLVMDGMLSIDGLRSSTSAEVLDRAE